MEPAIEVEVVNVDNAREGSESPVVAIEGRADNGGSPKMEAGTTRPLPSLARRSPLITTLSPSQLRRAELAAARKEPFGTGGQRPPATMEGGTAPPRCRAEDWPEKLRGYLETHAERPFDWATWNCCHFASDWVQQATGVDLLLRFRAQCTGLLTAQRILGRKGGVGGFFARVCNRYGFAQVHRYYAGRGDLVLFKAEEGACAVGICCGESFAAVGAGGIEYRDMREATHAFRVG